MSPALVHGSDYGAVLPSQVCYVCIKVHISFVLNDSTDSTYCSS